MIPVAIVADSPAVRAGLSAFIQTDSLLELTASVSAAAVTIVVSPEEDWTAEPDSAHIIVLSDGIPPADWLRSGVRGFLPLDAGRDEILAAIHAVHEGLLVFDPETYPIAQQDARRAAETPLTAREVEVVRLLAQGFSNKELAFRLNISEHTVKFHVTAIMSKLGAASRTEAVMLAVRQGLVPL